MRCRKQGQRRQHRGSTSAKLSEIVLCLRCPRATRSVQHLIMANQIEPTWSFIRFRRAPVPTLMILDANSTPMVCEDRILPKFS